MYIFSLEKYDQQLYSQYLENLQLVQAQKTHNVSVEEQLRSNPHKGDYVSIQGRFRKYICVPHTSIFGLYKKMGEINLNHHRLGSI